MTPGTHCSQQDPADILYIVSLEDLNALHDYLTAAIAGNDLSEIPRLWNQQIGIIRSRPHDTRVHPAASASHDALEKALKEIVRISNLKNIERRIQVAMMGGEAERALIIIHQQQHQERDTS